MKIKLKIKWNHRSNREKRETEWVIRMPRGRFSTWESKSDHEEKKEDNIRRAQNPGHSLPISEALRAAWIHTTFIMKMPGDKDWLNYLHTLYLIYSWPRTTFGAPTSHAIENPSVALTSPKLKLSLSICGGVKNPWSPEVLISIDAQVSYIKWNRSRRTVGLPHLRTPNRDRKQYRYLLGKGHE